MPPDFESGLILTRATIWLAMVGALPGRTQGLGLITESVLIDLRIDRINYAGMNLWASLLGSLFCLGFGRWLDRWGARALLTGIALALGGVIGSDHACIWPWVCTPCCSVSAS